MKVIPMYLMIETETHFVILKESEYFDLVFFQEVARFLEKKDCENYYAKLISK